MGAQMSATFDSTNVSGTFNPHSYDEGSCKYAFKGEYTRHPTKRGQPCVVKKNKASFIWDCTGWDMTMKVYRLSRTLANAFNQRNSDSTLSVRFMDVTECWVTSTSVLDTIVASSERIIVEDYLDGEFTKWTDNYGYISPNSELMPAFMHWSWVQSKGQTMIADLQGIKNDREYLLTDPVIMSNSVTGCQYGCTDTGVEGMAMFFLKHDCNQYCNTLPTPKLEDVLNYLSPRQQEVVKSEIKLMDARKRCKLDIPKDLKIMLKERMVSVFPRVASGQSPLLQTTPGPVLQSAWAGLRSAATNYRWQPYLNENSLFGPVYARLRTGEVVWCPFIKRAPRRR